MSPAGSNRLAILAAEIQDADGRSRRNAEQAAAAAIEAGHKLIEAKGLLRHGEWLPWLRSHVAISDRTARRYMQLAQSGLEIGHVANLGIAGAAAAAKPRRQFSADEIEWLDEAAVAWWKLIFKWSRYTKPDREKARIIILETLAEGGEHFSPLVRMFLRDTKDIDAEIEKRGPLFRAGLSEQEIETLAHTAVRSCDSGAPA
jgi:hypothetical protein